MEPVKSRPPLLLPTVRVSAEEQPSTSTAPPSEILSPKAQLPSASSMSKFDTRWFSYRTGHERTSSSSSDSGVISQFSPPQLLGQSISPVIALSPPGLSPLHVDSAFSTPTPSSVQGNRFTFDHVPFRRASDIPTHDIMPSAFDLPCSSKDPERLKDVLSSVRKDDGETINRHAALQRKQSIIHSGLSQETNAMLLSTLYASANRHSLISASLSSPLSSSGDTYHLGTSPNFLRVSPNSLDSQSTLSEQRSPLSFSSETVGDEDDKKQYYCNICKKDFKRPDILSRHLRRHTGEKPFGCEACGRYFSRSDHLRTHRRTHTDEKPYQCTICPYAARRRDVLTRHMATRHQAKAGLSIFQKHRDVRRCLSDGDEALNCPRSPEESPPPNTPKRLRHTTEILQEREHREHRDRTLTEVVRPRDRHITENDEILHMNEIEDDVIVDVCDLNVGYDEEADEDEGDIELAQSPGPAPFEEE